MTDKKNGFSLDPKNRPKDQERLEGLTGLKQKQILNLIDDNLVVDRRIDIFSLYQQKQMNQLRKNEDKLNDKTLKAQETQIEKDFDTLKRNVESMEYRVRGKEAEVKLYTQEQRDKATAGQIIASAEQVFGLRDDVSTGDAQAFVMQCTKLFNKLKKELGLPIPELKPEQSKPKMEVNK